jgi:hypothetical protein
MNRFLVGAVALVTLAACSGPTGPAGPQGAQGDPGPAGPAGPAGSSGTVNASVSGITPDHVFLARNAEVTISGFGTSWSSATTVDFGAGVTVKKLTVASPTALVADIQVDKGAAMGARNVTVKDAAGNTTYMSGFKVVSPIELTFTGTLAQGSILLAHVKNLDVLNPFDTTTSQSNPFAPPTYTNLALNLPMGVTAMIDNASDFGIDLQLNVDVSTMGMQDFDIVSGPPNDPSDVDFPLPKGLDIAARTPTPLMAGTPATGNSTMPLQSQLFSFTPGSASLSIVDFSATSGASKANPLLFLLPKSGAWTDLLTADAQPTWLTSSTDPMYAVYVDASGGTGTYSVAVDATAPAATAATTANDGSKAGAVAASALPFVLTGGSLATAMSQDWVQVTVTQADAGKSLWVQTVDDYATDVTIMVFGASGMVQVGSTVENANGAGPANGLIGPVNAGTYYVVFGAGQQFDPSHNLYQGIIRLK